LAIIGVLSGAWLGLDFLRHGTKKAAPAVTLPHEQASAAVATPAPEKPVSAPGSQGGHSDVKDVHGAIGYVMELFKRFNADHCPAWAAALSFFSILSFIPLLLCGIAVLGIVIQDPHEAAKQVEGFVATLLPGKGTQAQAQEIIQRARIEERARDLANISGFAGVFGLLSLFWAASRIFVNAATPMNAAFRTQETRGFIKMQLYALGLLIGAGALFVLSLLPSSGVALLRNIPFLSGLPDPSPWWLNVLLFLLGVAINALMFTVIYRFMPSPSALITWKEAGVGGAVTAVLWEAAKQGFAFYLSEFAGDPKEDKMYGALGGLILLVLWVYYSSMILLLGAEICKLYSDAQDAKTT
jgi:membrane protein